MLRLDPLIGLAQSRYAFLKLASDRREIPAGAAVSADKLFEGERFLSHPVLFLHSLKKESRRSVRPPLRRNCSFSVARGVRQLALSRSVTSRADPILSGTMQGFYAGESCLGQQITVFRIAQECGA